MREIGILANQHIINVGGARLFHSAFNILHFTFNWLFNALRTMQSPRSVSAQPRHDL